MKRSQIRKSTKHTRENTVRQVSTPKTKKRAFKDDIEMISDLLKNNKQMVVGQQNADDVDAIKLMSDQKKYAGAKGSAPVPMTFFYTNDKIFTQLDDAQITSTIVGKYPEFIAVDEVELKVALVNLISDKLFVLALLDFYNMSLQDFFAFIFRRNPSIFKGPYLSKIQKIIAAVGYEQ